MKVIYQSVQEIFWWNIVEIVSWGACPWAPHPREALMARTRGWGEAFHQDSVLENLTTHLIYLTQPVIRCLENLRNHCAETLLQSPAHSHEIHHLNPSS